MLGAGLVWTRREGTTICYSVAGDDVVALFAELRSVAGRIGPHTDDARRRYLGHDDVKELDLAELLRRSERRELLVRDVRPAAEDAAAHLPGAMHVPLEELEQRLGELPSDRELVAYCRGSHCALAQDAVRLLTAHVGAIAAALFAMRLAARAAAGAWTFGWKHAEILSAAGNGHHPARARRYHRGRGGPPSAAPAHSGRWPGPGRCAGWGRGKRGRCVAAGRANRTSLNVQGARQHIPTDLYGFIGTVVAGIVILLTR